MIICNILIDIKSYKSYYKTWSNSSKSSNVLRVDHYSICNLASVDRNHLCRIYTSSCQIFKYCNWLAQPMADPPPFIQHPINQPWDFPAPLDWCFCSRLRSTAADWISNCQAADFHQMFWLLRDAKAVFPLCFLPSQSASGLPCLVAPCHDAAYAGQTQSKRCCMRLNFLTVNVHH